MLRDIYLGSGWSVLAWIGTAITLAAAIGIVVAVLDMRTPHTPPRPAQARHRRRPVSRVSLIGELAVRAAGRIASAVLAIARLGARR